MGNWTRVKIVGSCASEHVAALMEYLSADFMDDRWGCLHNGGLAGLPNWSGEMIEAVGNLGERDFTALDIRDELEKIAKIAPSLVMQVHVGADYERENCVHTIHLLDGKAKIVNPGITTIPEISKEHIEQAFMRLMFK